MSEDRIEHLRKIEAALAAFGTHPLADASSGLLKTLGYESERRMKLRSPDAAGFLDTFDRAGILNRERALVVDWRRVEFLFQLTDSEVQSAAHGTPELAFDSHRRFDGAEINSFLFLAIELRPASEREGERAGQPYSRTELAGLTRAINRLFDMPVLLVFKHGDTLSLGIIHRRLSKRDATKDVLEKVTLIKDITFVAPHRAHLDILADLALPSLLSSLPCEEQIINFVTLHRAWGKTLDVQALNRRFFIEIRNWFYWARLYARFPAGATKDADGRDSEALIRLLTRLIFCWFLREKDLLPNELFSTRQIERLLADWRSSDSADDQTGRYYLAILQNLFFATLATPVEERRFRAARSYQGKNKHYGDQRYFRHVGLFQAKAPVEDLYQQIPFLNGGLFENLDEFPNEDSDLKQEVRVDGFSDTPAKQPLVPDYLFFGDERPVPEIAALLGESGAPKARGLLNIFRDYKFTIEENTPLEEDIALDPELLGRAFENLLAAVNPETGTVARKSTGSFYTPREIVHYMVEEALVRWLLGALAPERAKPDLEAKVRELVSVEAPSHRLQAEAGQIVGILSRLRIFDPACGSGAFPMGLLQLLVAVLRKIDPENAHWKASKLAALPPEMREKAEPVFRHESFDYTRKLELIKDCIHGVDIQPTAIQITKLRFFLSLVIEQKNRSQPRPLPNLETKFVCANSLLGLPRPEGWDLFQHQIEPKERALLTTRSRYFFAWTKKEKDACKRDDRRMRREIGEFIRDIGGSAARQLASAVAEWDPYKADRRAGYFDPESMFGVTDGFDITIGNPPYVRADEQSEWNREQRKTILDSKQYETLWEKWDLFVPFLERSYKLLRPGGVSTLIVSDAYCHSKYAQKSQNWFLKNARILRLDFCGEVKIFDAAVHNVIYFFQRADGAKWKPDRRVHRKTFGEVSLLPTDEQAKLTNRVFFPEDTAVQVFSSKTLPLIDICYISVGMVINADEKAAKGAFHTGELISPIKDKLHPKAFVEGKNLSRWIFSENSWLEWGTSRAPHQFRRQTFPELYEQEEKLMLPMVGAIRGAIDTQQFYCNHGIFVSVLWHQLHGVRNSSLKKAARYRGEKPLRPDLPKREELEAISRRFSVKYLLGVINSGTARNFLRAHRRNNVQLYPDDWKRLPIPDIPPAKQAPITALVDQILTAKRATPAADTTVLEAEIDALVYVLYGLTEQEITIAEGKK
ncbi:MAG: Eco57I restriction-modification methylase domain-containing protein [Puniceicoccales bacterium]|jgi:hypothetical protein|nr:Eco57I restriction-modification methylase domain-containing protein [Puniceicoccales bacterium]